MRIALAAAVSLAFAGSALALDHAETPLKTSGCKVLKMEKRDLDGKPLAQKDRYPSEWRCQGIGDTYVYIKYDGERESIAFGSAELQTTEDIRQGGLGRWGPVIEWRGKRDAMGALEPDAVIVKYTWIDPESGTKAEDADLTVIRLGEGATDTCAVARINTLANRDAIEIARRTADGEAVNYKCRDGQEPEYRGRTR